MPRKLRNLISDLLKAGFSVRKGNQGGFRVKVSDKYLKLIYWSEEDNCFIGICPELFYAGCHGNDQKQVFDELCKIIDEIVEVYIREGKFLPQPVSGTEIMNQIQKVA